MTRIVSLMSLFVPSISGAGCRTVSCLTSYSLILVYTIRWRVHYWRGLPHIVLIHWFRFFGDSGGFSPCKFNSWLIFKWSSYRVLQRSVSFVVHVYRSCPSFISLQGTRVSFSWVRLNGPCTFRTLLPICYRFPVSFGYILKFVLTVSLLSYLSPT